MVILSHIVRKIAYEMIAEAVPGLTASDAKNLRTRGPSLLKKIQKKGKDTLSEMSVENKKVLLAYVVYLRQNITTSKKDVPNSEDAAQILHEDLFEGKEEKLDDELKKQLSKIGITLKKEE